MIASPLRIDTGYENLLSMALAAKVNEVTANRMALSWHFMDLLS